MMTLDLPHGWEAKSMLRLSKQIFDYRGRTPKKLGMDWGGGDIPALSAGNVKMGFIDWSAECYFGSEGLYRKWMTQGRPSKDDILFTTEAPLGNVALVPDDRRYILSQRTILLQIDPLQARSKFVAQMMSSEAFQRMLADYSSGSTAKGIQRRKFERLEIAVPPLDEQKSIETALSDVDSLLAALDRLIAKKRDLKQAAMQQLLTGQTRLPGFRSVWEATTLIQLAEGKKELFDDGDWIESEHIVDRGIRLIQTGNIGVGRFLDKGDKKYISESSFKLLRCKELHRGDLLICRLADPAGRACVLPDIGEQKVVTSVDVTIFRPSEERANRDFFAHLFSTPEWFIAVENRSGGTTHKRIARGALGKISICIPPVEEQSAISAVLSGMEAELASLETRRDKTRALKQAMMQELLTGRVRLI
ncbi:restriction endonuclease subunit S [Paracidovorax avenae]|uniref:restriction endonuclease subunit S n=1 Tax=Paracidovorax avenae TaxID=80867 RepID=UPI000D20D122|nr:restriction endonuclease subunit S [Paracidovorax avenae]AVS83514.1 restriction endonuclease subunit S [Paracidovorax avenae]